MNKIRIRRQSGRQQVAVLGLQRLRALYNEAIEGIAQRPSRSAMTAAGTLLGVAVLVAVLGLTATVAAQIGAEFTTIAATQVSVSQQPSRSQLPTLEFGANPVSTVDRLNGVQASGIWWQARAQAHGPAATTAAKAPVMATSPQMFNAAQIQLRQGRSFDEAANKHQLPVAVLGPTAASELGISDLTLTPAIQIGGKSFVVIGIIDQADRLPNALAAVLIPDATATKMFGLPASLTPPMMLIRVDLGAANQVGDQVATALRPDQPELFTVVRPPDANQLRRAVDNNLNSLLLILAGVILIIGMAGIANTTFVSVIERTPEIGLRRAVGAQPGEIAGQFLIEAAMLGLLGGLAGAALGTLTVVAVAIANDWTAVIPANLTLIGPGVGLLVGLLAGLLPAWRAARIEPLEALRA